MITSNSRLRGSLQSTPENLTAGSSGDLDVRHKQLSWKMWKKCLRIFSSGIPIKVTTMSVKTSGVFLAPELTSRKYSRNSTYSSRMSASEEFSNHPRRLKERWSAENQYVACSRGKFRRATGSKLARPLMIPALRLISAKKTFSR